MGNYEDALKYIDLIAVDSLRRVSPEMASDYYFNRGNLFLQQKDYQNAVDSYKESLRLSSQNMDAKSNLAYAQKMLKEEQNQQNQNQQDQNQDQNQNQNQDQNQDQNEQNNQDKKENQDQNQQQPPQNNQGESQPPKITPQTANQMLQAIEDKEKDTQEKVKKAKALEQKKKKKEKNW